MLLDEIQKLEHNETELKNMEKNLTVGHSVSVSESLSRTHPPPAL